MASIKNFSTFVIQTGEAVNSIRLDTLQEQMAPLARQAGGGFGGRAGLMFPDDTLVYDGTTGRLSVKSNYIREYVGLIGYDTVAGETPNMNGFETQGNFYVVADFEYKYMQNDWGTSGSNRTDPKRVYVGDIVEKSSGDSGDWKIIPMQIGNTTVHSDFSKYVHIGQVTNYNVIGDTVATGDEYILQAEGY